MHSSRIRGFAERFYVVLRFLAIGHEKYNSSGERDNSDNWGQGNAVMLRFGGVDRANVRHILAGGVSEALVCEGDHSQHD
jgi:hypothetical protein